MIQDMRLQGTKRWTWKNGDNQINKFEVKLLSVKFTLFFISLLFKNEWHIILLFNYFFPVNFLVLWEWSVKMKGYLLFSLTTKYLTFPNHFLFNFCARWLFLFIFLLYSAAFLQSTDVRKVCTSFSLSRECVGGYWRYTSSRTSFESFT